MASTLARSRPSEKLGTHSISRFMVEVRLSAAVYRNARLRERTGCFGRSPPPARHSGLIPHVDYLAALHCHPAALHSKIIGNFAIILHFEDRQVRLLAGLERTQRFIAAQGIRGVEGGRGDRLSGGHP